MDPNREPGRGGRGEEEKEKKKGAEAEKGNKGEVANSLEDLGIKHLWGEIRSLYAIRQHRCSGN